MVLSTSMQLVPEGNSVRADILFRRKQWEGVLNCAPVSSSTLLNPCVLLCVSKTMMAYKTTQQRFPAQSTHMMRVFQLYFRADLNFDSGGHL